MLWKHLSAKVEENLKRLPPPFMLFIQLGSNDLGTIKSADLIEDMKRDLLRMRLLLPEVRIIWSDILMRRYWHAADNGTAMELARKRVNLAIKNYLKDDNCSAVINHPNIRAREKSLYRFDGTHLTDT